MKMKRKLKGMTLMEVVVSLAVYAVIGLLIAEIMTLVNGTMKATNQLNRRLSYEAKFADNLLYSDGVRTFTPENASISISGGNGANVFNISTNGSVYETSAQTIEDPSTKMLINKSRNYRFLVFTKALGGLAVRDEVFHIELELGTSTDIADNPVTKMIVNAKDAPTGQAYANKLSSGALYQTQVIYDTHEPADADAEVKVQSVGLEAMHSGKILDLYVPVVEPAEDDHSPVRGQVTVLIFRKVKDQNSHEYNWFNTDDVKKLQIGFTSGDPMCDSNRFPGETILTLDFVVSADNPNTHKRAYFEGVKYKWNPSEDPDATDSKYLVAEKAIGSQ